MIQSALKAFVGAVALSMTACSVPVVEIVRVSNPSEAVEAIVGVSQGGAVSSGSYQIYLTRKGAAEWGDPIFVADQVSNLRVKWDGDARLLVSLDRARLQRQTPNWRDGAMEVAVNYEIAKK